MSRFDDFPLVARERAAGRSYLDSAATTQMPSAVIEAVRAFHREENGSIKRGVYDLSARATERYESARATVGDFIGAARPDREIIFCSGATEAINLVARSWGDFWLGRDDEIVLSTMEHHSNLVPWQQLASRTGARLVELVPDGEGRIPEGALERLLGPRTRLVGLTHVSNLLGTVNDVAAAARAAHDAGALLLVDGAQATGHLPVDVAALGCDFYAGSGHKMFGPTGIGFLYGRSEILESCPPFLGGGSMIDEVRFEKSTYAPLPERFEAGTPNLAGAVGLAAAARYLDAIGMEAIARHDGTLVAAAHDRLSALPGIEIYGPRDAARRSGLVSFNIAGAHSHDVGTLLDMAGVAVRTGHLCVQPLLRHLGKGSCVRASFAIYNDESDVDRLVDAVRFATDRLAAGQTEECN